METGVSRLGKESGSSRSPWVRRGTRFPGNFWSPVLLVIAVVVPASCVFWFMMEATGNERLAVQQRLSNAYRDQLVAAGRSLETYWESKRASLSVTDEASPAEAFANLVRAGAVDSVLILNSSGTVVYPGDTRPSRKPPASSTFSQAWDLEFRASDFSTAARDYARVAAQSDDLDLAALALIAQARSLAKAGEASAALEILAESLSSPRFRSAVDSSGNLIFPNAQLRALEMIDDPSQARWQEIRDALINYVRDYRNPLLSSPQRLFLMERLSGMTGTGATLDTLTAERMAWRFLESGTVQSKQTGLQISPLYGVWRIESVDQRVVALLTQERVRAESVAAIKSEFRFTDVDIGFEPPGTAVGSGTVVESAGSAFPGWQLTLQATGSDPFGAAADERIRLYWGVGILFILGFSLLAFWVGRYVTSQIRVTKLRNDLIATISHELKTPLASMRVLVDTLLREPNSDPGRAEEYLSLIAKENLRLSRLVENFLAFSKLEKGHGSFHFVEVEVESLFNAALTAVRDQFDRPGVTLTTEVPLALPKLSGDPGALTSALVNLLENAYKYTGDKKDVVLRAFAEKNNICLQVQDNGVGIPRRAAKKVFDRFFQVDQSLSRSGDGCGLGLSIVKFIVRAHKGSVSVVSEPGLGSTFTVRLPAK